MHAVPMPKGSVDTIDSRTNFTRIWENATTLMTVMTRMSPFGAEER